MYFVVETRQYGYIFDLSKYHVSFFNGMIGIYEYDSSERQPCLTFDIHDVEKISLREEGEF